VFASNVTTLGYLVVTDSLGCKRRTNWSVEGSSPVGIQNYTKQLTCVGSQTFIVDLQQLIIGNTIVNGHSVLGAGPTKGTYTLINQTSFEYEPSFNQTGSDVFSIVVNTINGALVTHITVIHTPCIDVVVAIDDTITIDCNSEPVVIDVLLNDETPNQISSVTLFTPPLHGSASINSDFYIEYEPLVAFEGVDVLEYMITDIYGQTSVATITINVNHCEDPSWTTPLVQQIYTCITDNTFDLTSVLNYSAPGYLAVTIITPPILGTISANGLEIRYTPDTGTQTNEIIELVVYDTRNPQNIVSTIIEIEYIIDCCNDPISLDFIKNEHPDMPYRSFDVFKTGAYKEPNIILSDTVEMNKNSTGWIPLTSGLTICDYTDAAGDLSLFTRDVLQQTAPYNLNEDGIEFQFILDTCNEDLNNMLGFANIKNVTAEPVNLDPNGAPYPSITTSFVYDAANDVWEANHVFELTDLINYGDINFKFQFNFLDGNSYDKDILMTNTYTTPSLGTGTCTYAIERHRFVNQQYTILIRRTLEYTNNCNDLVKLFETTIGNTNDQDLGVYVTNYIP
jgi:hypothetical protein